MKVDLEALLDLESKATPGEWEYDEYDRDVRVKNTHLITADDVIPEDGKLIQAMRNSIRELCLELKVLRELVSAAWDCECLYASDGSKPIKRLVSVLKKYDEVTREG